MMDMQAYDIVLVPIIIGLVRAAKLMGLPSRWQPALALLLGVIGSWIYVAPDDFKQALLTGVVMGLSAMGLWSGVKNVLERKEDQGD